MSSRLLLRMPILAAFFLQTPALTLRDVGGAVAQGDDGAQKRRRTFAVMVCGGRLVEYATSDGKLRVSIDEGEAWDRGDGHDIPVAVGQWSSNDRLSRPVPFAQTWSSLMEVLVASMRRARVDVDVFLCVSSMPTLSPPAEVKGIFAFSAGNQIARARGCWKHIENTTSGYDFYLKTRPDFVYWGDRMNWGSLRRDRLYSRFRAVGGIANLTSEHMAYNTCTSKCDGLGPAYINDDMIWVAHRSMVSRVTALGCDSARRPTTARYWLGLHPSGMPGAEMTFTTSLQFQGVLTHPLAITGYPSYSKYNHRKVNECHNPQNPTRHVFEKMCSEAALSLEEHFENFYCSEDALQRAVAAVKGNTRQRLANNIKQTAAALCSVDRRQTCCRLGWHADPIEPTC